VRFSERRPRKRGVNVEIMFLTVVKHDIIIGLPDSILPQLPERASRTALRVAELSRSATERAVCNSRSDMSHCVTVSRRVHGCPLAAIKL
jgi:hypothetical protein